jgi:hypothetical protein
MHIEEITIGQLGEFIASPRFKKQNILPITVHRALSQIKNPRANQEDVVLFIALDEADQIVAYAGALPDLIHGTFRVAWNSCWYADTNVHKSIALPLFFAFIKRWQGKIIMQDLTKHTKEIIKNLSYFKFIRQMDGMRIFIRFYFSDIICKKYNSLRKIRFILTFADAILNIFVLLHLYLWKIFHPQSKDIRSEEIFTIDDQVKSFIELNNTLEICKRGKPELDWICENPWIIIKNKMNADLIDKYHFSSLAESFSYRRLKIVKGNDLICFCILKERDRHFEIPYLYCEDENIPVSINALIHYLIDQKALSFAYFNPKLEQGKLDQSFPSVYRKKLQRELVVSKELETSVTDNIKIQDGDGDSVFT